MSASTKQTGDLPIACTLSETEQVKRRQEIAVNVAQGIRHVKELTDGYAFGFPGDEAWAAKLMEFISFERRCCQFLTFELVFEPGEGPIWLRLRGAEGVKQFIREGLNIDLTP